MSSPPWFTISYQFQVYSTVIQYPLWVITRYGYNSIHISSSLLYSSGPQPFLQGACSGNNASMGMKQMKLCLFTQCSFPRVQPVYNMLAVDQYWPLSLNPTSSKLLIKSPLKSLTLHVPEEKVVSEDAWMFFCTQNTPLAPAEEEKVRRWHQPRPHGISEVTVLLAPFSACFSPWFVDWQLKRILPSQYTLNYS